MIQGTADGVDGNDPTGMDVIKPERPHGDLAFEELARRYNFRLTSNPKHLFTRVQYRFNGERRTDACAPRQGFQSPEYAYVESEGPIGYQPGPLRPLFHIFTIKRQLFKSPKALITLLCRMTKPADRPPP